MKELSMLRLHAKIRFHTEAEGGMNRDPRSGIKPNFKVGEKGDLITSRIHEVNGRDVMIRGEDHNVEILLAYGEVYAKEIVPGLKFTLQAGSWIFGRGEVIEILEITG